MKTIFPKKLFVATSLAGLFVLAPAAFAQPGGGAQTSSKGAVIKGKAPVNKEVLRVKLPKAQEATLSNGLQVVLLPSHRVPTFSMQMVILSGGLSDPQASRGTASFTASLLREGTTKRSSQDIAQQSEALGATLGASSGLASFTTNVTAAGLVENLDQTLDIFADVVRNPTFPAAEVEKFKTRTLAQLQMQRSIPQLLAAERFNRAIYGEHPAAFVTPPVESLRALTSDSLKQFHQTYFRPNNAILAITGDVTMKELLPRLEKAFGDWQKGEVPKTNIPTVGALSKPGIFLIDRPGSVQTVLQLGNVGIERTSPDYFAVLVMNQIFGGGPQARLFMNLREDKGYTYGAYSGFGGSKFAGTVQASSEVRTDVTQGALKEFMYEIKRIRDEKVPAEELENAKRSIIGSFALQLEQPQFLLSNIVTQKLYGFPTSYWDDYPQQVAKITVDDVQRAAQKYLDLPHLQIVAVGDASKIREALAAYGSVEQYDAEGKVVNPAAAGKP
ncbi:MAG: insulinase family protein [Acidobacteriota bacterium]|nr:insulinase family protein [Acidobacteriota bacterium]